MDMTVAPIYRLASISLLGFGLLSFATRASADPVYTVTNLGWSVGQIETSGLNDLGQVVGAGRSANNGYYGFLYNSFGPNAGKIQDVGGVGTSVDAINNQGQLMLNAAYPNGSGSGAWVLSGGTRTPVGSLLDQPYNQTFATAINNRGQVVGFSDANPNDPTVSWSVLHAIISTNGKATDLGTLPGGYYSQASAINDQGQVVGYSNFEKTENVFQKNHAFLYSNGTMSDLGTLGGTQSYATGINNAGQIVGSSTLTSNVEGAVHAFLYQNGAMHDLGTLGGQSSWAYGINHAGHIVGTSQTGATTSNQYGVSPVYHAFLYENGKMMDLNNFIASSSGWTITSARAINNLGQILAGGIGPNGHIDDILLTPSNLPAPPAPVYPPEEVVGVVPEPTTLAMYAVVVTALGARRALRRSQIARWIWTLVVEAGEGPMAPTGHFG
jgi:probable HAF family extracellular repeat protein